MVQSQARSQDQYSKEIAACEPIEPEILEQPAPVRAPDPLAELLADLDMDALDGENVEDVIRELENDRDDRPNKVTKSDLERPNKVTKSEKPRPNKVTDGPEKSLPKKVTKRFRSSDLKDRQLIEQTRKLSIDFDSPETPPLVEIFNPPISPPKTRVSPPLILRTAWEYTGERLKLSCANDALEVFGDEQAGLLPTSWSVNLSGEREAEALADPKGFVDCLRRYIVRALKRELGRDHPLYWFSVDVERGRLHLHGAVLVTAGESKSFQAAMCHAAGKIDARAFPKAAAKQFNLNPSRCDDGWVTYAMRNRSAVKRLIGERTTSIPHELRARAQWTYSEARALIRAHI